MPLRFLRTTLERLTLCRWLLFCTSLCVSSSVCAQKPNIDFDKLISPLLIKRCVECHTASNPSGLLDLSSAEGLRRGGESGEVLDLQTPEESYLIQRVLDGEMPPSVKGQPQPLPESETSLLRQWIASGATWPDHRTLSLFEQTTEDRAGLDWWSLKTVVQPEVSQTHQQPQPANPIDAFVLHKLEAAGMVAAPQADKRVLIRRLYYDLIGISPTAEQIESYVQDESPTAWEDLVDSLLEMPQYGERWARYWLDLARYADTSGYERDQEKSFAWKYRDWVVNAFNQDMPYAQFVIEQIAGDEIDQVTEQSVIATGFLRLGTWNDEPNDPKDYQYDRLEDLVHTTSSTFLAMTVKCARCHTHKFDPISQDDYYRMASVFWPGPIAARDRKLLGGPSSEELGFEHVLGWTDITSRPGPLHLLKNGERLQPLHQVAPASLSFLPALEHPFKLSPANARTTQRRLQLAKWIANPRNPLTPRVMVNRIWQQHFGAGIVRTPNNFGFLSDPPTHPQLLEWLAAEFVNNGGSIKSIHKLILTSQTWKQSSIHPEQLAYRDKDGSNRLLWHAQRRRLDAEALRDSILAAAGELNLQMGGESFKASVDPAALEGLSRKSSAWEASPAAAQKRRSLYMYMKRGLLPPFMTAFDLCDATQSVGKRDVTTVPTQSLTFLNNSFVHQQSETLAKKIAASTDDPEAQVRMAWSAILKRQPQGIEMRDSLTHLKNQLQNFSVEASRSPHRDINPKHAALNSSLDNSLRLHLRADQVTTGSDSMRVQLMRDLSGHDHHAFQKVVQAQPQLSAESWNGVPFLQFNGNGEFLHVTGQPLTSPLCTIVCVVSDTGKVGHREVISNWNSKDNVGTSMFLGLTKDNRVRFTDQFTDAGQVTEQNAPFILSAINGDESCEVFQSGRKIGMRFSTLGSRKLDSPWVIGQQGNIQGEFWQGGIAEVRVYDRALTVAELQSIESELANRYGLDLSLPVESIERTVSDDILALASLCHVLLNSNEFIYVD